ncbi:MAG: hypothetical protein WC282_02520 [Bacilli bacterium]|jgi:hypothetical protein
MIIEKEKTAIVTICGPKNTSWVGDLNLEIAIGDKVVGTLKAQQKIRFEINEDTRFYIRCLNSFLANLNVRVAGLLRCPTNIQLVLVGGSLANAKLVAKTTYGENYKR